MIPLAQYLNDIKDDEFSPFRPVERRAPAPCERSAASAIPAVRPIKPVSPRPTLASAKPIAAVIEPEPAPSVPLAEMRAAEARWAQERQALEAAVDRARTEAVAERELALRAEIESEAEARLDLARGEIQARHTALLAAERERWTVEQSDRLADCVILQMAVFEDSMRAAVRGVLRPLAMEARQRQALESLAEAVTAIAPEGAGYRIAATGPSDLLDRFRERLGDRAGAVVVRADERRTDLRVEADQTLIETRLGAWGEALEKALS